MPCLDVCYVLKSLPTFRAGPNGFRLAASHTCAQPCMTQRDMKTRANALALSESSSNRALRLRRVREPFHHRRAPKCFRSCCKHHIMLHHLDQRDLGICQSCVLFCCLRCFARFIKHKPGAAIQTSLYQPFLTSFSNSSILFSISLQRLPSLTSSSFSQEC